jgi:predicted TIM-barrel fold metal-dependent hydrolase
VGVDSHAHVWQRPLQLIPGARHRPEYDAPVDAFIANLDRNGLARGLLIQPSFLGTDNSLMLDAVRRYPERLKAVVVIDPAASMEELAALEGRGAAGVRYNLIGLPLIDFTRGPYPAFHRRLAERGWHVELHREARDLPALVAPLLAQGVKVAIDHFGRPDPVLQAADPAFARVLAWGREPRVWLKASAAYRCGGDAGARSLMPRVLDHFDAKRVLWASDWPHTQHETLVTYDATFDLFERTVPDAAVRARILEQAPAELYP